ncbi:hypothetical protein Nepgr_033671 [Nepenthes gracilis]|uniref:Uncharacterized protein n=1 Tax=Nepenthes gracilis TaxID=150966 RepID=A0AAD3Y6S8_NEPGR|nr:hypothetical protein Nepgr_033671 [Nepenthes gracilis]
MDVVDTDVGLNPRNEHVLPSYSALSRVKDFGVCLFDAGHFKTSYGGVKIDGAVEPDNGGVQGMDALHCCPAHKHKDLHGLASSSTVKLCLRTQDSSLKGHLFGVGVLPLAHLWLEALVLAILQLFCLVVLCTWMLLPVPWWWF